MDLYFDENTYADSFKPIICLILFSLKKFPKTPLKIAQFLISEHDRLKCFQIPILLILIIG